MNSEQLRHELELLRQQIEVLQPHDHAEDLRAYFAGPEFDEHREELLAALLSSQPHYSFRVQLPEDPDGCPSEFLVSWYDRSQPPTRIHLQRIADWREMKYGREVREGAPDAPDDGAGMVDATSVPLALSDLPRSAPGGHSAQPATPVTPASSVEPATTPHAPTATPATTATAEEIAAERVRIEARIAELEQQMEMHQAGPTPPRRVVRPPSSAAAAAPARGASEWRGRMF